MSKRRPTFGIPIPRELLSMPIPSMKTMDKYMEIKKELRYTSPGTPQYERLLAEERVVMEEIKRKEQEIRAWKQARALENHRRVAAKHEMYLRRNGVSQAPKKQSRWPWA